MCFVSSHKRLDIAGGRLRDLPGVRRVFTSNLAAYEEENCLTVDYDRYLNEDPMVADNAVAADAQEGIDAFLPKRHPQWQHRR